MEKEQNKAGNTNDKKVSPLSSVRTKVLSVLIVDCILLSVILCMVFLTSVRNQLTELNSNYLYDLAVAYGSEVQDSYETVGYDAFVDYNHLKGMLSDAGIKGISSSYAYLVGADGTMLYHPTADKVGQPVENEVVTGVVQKLKAGKIPKPEVVQYIFKGAKKFAAYSVTEGGEFILVISADEKDIMAKVNRVTTVAIATSIMCVLLFAVMGFLVMHLITHPIVQVTSVVGRLADMDFREMQGNEKLLKRKDETGVMIRAVSILREELADVITRMRDQSEKVYNASDVLNANAEETAGTLEQVEKAVAEIAEGATSQADETQKATENVIVMGNMVEETSREVKDLIKNANAMQKSSAEATATLSELEKINEQAREAIDIIYEQTNTTNESAMKIREATSLITSIAEETNLLSLNASIEAARAGEQGRGFVVVASQIQKLAEQSNKSASQIESIIDSLISDSQKAVETMGEVREIMDNQNRNVERTNIIFTEVSQMVATSIEGIGKIADKTKMLDEARVQVVDVVQNLTAIAEENAASTEESSASVTEVSAIVTGISGNARELKNVADELEQGMKIFQM